MIKNYFLTLSLIAFLAPSLSACLPVMATGAAVTGGMVASDERSAGTIIDDSLIKSKILYKLKIGSEHNESLKNISVKVNEGRVLLAGTAPNNDAVSKAIEEAWSVAGVKEVIAEVDPENSNSTWYSSNDMWIKSQIKTQYLLQKRFDSVNYTVVVKDGVVYLFGIAQDEEEKETAIHIARTTRGVKNVVNHVILRNDQRRGEHTQ